MLWSLNHALALCNTFDSELKFRLFILFFDELLQNLHFPLTIFVGIPVARNSETFHFVKDSQTHFQVIALETNVGPLIRCAVGKRLCDKTEHFVVGFERVAANLICRRRPQRLCLQSGDFNKMKSSDVIVVVASGRRLVAAAASIEWLKVASGHFLFFFTATYSFSAQKTKQEKVWRG